MVCFFCIFLYKATSPALEQNALKLGGAYGSRVFGFRGRFQFELAENLSWATPTYAISTVPIENDAIKIAFEIRRGLAIDFVLRLHRS